MLSLWLEANAASDSPLNLCHKLKELFKDAGVGKGFGLRIRSPSPGFELLGNGFLKSKLGIGIGVAAFILCLSIHPSSIAACSKVVHSASEKKPYLRR